MTRLDLRRLKFVDEAGVNPAMTRLWGRAAKARTHEALETAIRAAMDTVIGLEAYNWLRHCGYALS